MFSLPDLSYGYDALSRSISPEIMELHHKKHHQAYVDKLNVALDTTPELAGQSIEQVLQSIDSAPESVRTALRNHGGGHYNHSLFWQMMSPDGGGEPVGELAEAITDKYGSYQAFVDKFTTNAMGVFGSGWAWLMPDMEIVTSPNQDSPLMTGGPAPLLGLDVWEHAYYLDYKNKRDDYIRSWWDVVDWQFVAERYSRHSS